ncbi:unnamed protein product [Arctogadus glacialis]
MGEERRWLLLAVTTALTLSLLSVCPGGASLVRARVGRVAELGCDLAPSPPDAAAAAAATAPGATPPGAAPDLFPLHVVEWVRLGYNVPILIKFGVYAPRVHPNYKARTLWPRPVPHVSRVRPPVEPVPLDCTHGLRPGLRKKIINKGSRNGVMERGLRLQGFRLSHPSSSGALPSSTESPEGLAISQPGNKAPPDR